MGMLFNTPATLDWVKTGHQKFASAWATFQAAPATWTPIFRSLGTGGTSTYSVLSAPPLDLIHKTLNPRWQAWLGLMDTAGVSRVIGGCIADAINNIGHTFSGVEFHFVPSGTISASCADLPDSASHGATYTKSIVIYTVTWDNVAP